MKIANVWVHPYIGYFNVSFKDQQKDILINGFSSRYQVCVSEVACLLAGHGREEFVGKAAGTDTEKILI